jgi:hypothetical protein
MLRKSAGTEGKAGHLLEHICGHVTDGTHTRNESER